MQMSWAIWINIFTNHPNRQKRNQQKNFNINENYSAVQWGERHLQKAPHTPYPAPTHFHSTTQRSWADNKLWLTFEKGKASSCLYVCLSVARIILNVRSHSLVGVSGACLSAHLPAYLWIPLNDLQDVSLKLSYSELMNFPWPKTIEYG